MTEHSISDPGSNQLNIQAKCVDHRPRIMQLDDGVRLCAAAPNLHLTSSIAFFAHILHSYARKSQCTGRRLPHFGSRR